MKILIYSDVHGNLPAFEQMLKVEDKCDEYISLGDLVNYGPWSNECVDLALSLPNSTLLMGNHEEAFIDGRYLGSNPLVQSFFGKTFPSFTRKEEIRGFAKESRLGKFICTHTINDASIYPDTELQLDANYIIGHSHHQFRYTNNNFELFNAGSVGQNRKFIDEINYLTFDSETSKITMKSLVYDVDLLLGQMIHEGYPQACMDYYLSKERRGGCSR